jgi:hypothetical protein
MALRIFMLIIFKIKPETGFFEFVLIFFKWKLKTVKSQRLKNQMGDGAKLSEIGL